MMANSKNMSYIYAIKVRTLPKGFTAWLENKIGRKVLQSEELSIHVLKPRSKKKRMERKKEWDEKMERRKQRLERVARKMLKSGMNKADTEVVRRGGWDK